MSKDAREDGRRRSHVTVPVSVRSRRANTVVAGSTAEMVLDALGDSTRRDIVKVLANGRRTVGQLSDALPITRSAVSQHLKVLREAQLVSSIVEGTRHVLIHYKEKAAQWMIDPIDEMNDLHEFIAWTPGT